ncbi:HNH endonuclease signature motif containing protein [Dactylosporangium sp. NPDC051485]|uniref:HNH endonuclease n=1 Tax=Dactylosporangium sp. NPDC051485 TaxID=3154846 RepID=UPI003425F698
MWSVPRPGTDAGYLYRTCVATVSDDDRRATLEGFEAGVVKAADRYAVEAAAAALHNLADLADQPADPDDRKALRRVYTRSLVDTKAGRSHYDALLAAAPLGRCPFCGHRDVATLDHQLPKSSYPLLAVVPDNLVPACSDCNHLKNNRVATTAATQALHPYFEHAEHARWLFARVGSLDPGTVVVFHADPDPAFAPAMRERIRHQFTEYRLAALYGMQAAREMAGRRAQLAGLQRAAGPAGLARHLRETAESWSKESLNCWQHALYDALAVVAAGQDQAAA